MSNEDQDEGPAKQATEQKIREQALRLFANRGFDGTTMRDVATSLGISKGLVTYHFPKKNDLFRAAITVPYEAFVGDLRGLLADTERSSRERLRDIITRLAGISETEVLLIRAVFRELLTAPEHLADLIGLFRSGHVFVIVQAIQDAIRDGVLPKGIGPGILPAIMGATVLPSVLAISLIRQAPDLAFARIMLESGHHDLLVLLGIDQ